MQFINLDKNQPHFMGDFAKNSKTYFQKIEHEHQSSIQRIPENFSQFKPFLPI